MGELSENFSRKEFACKCGCGFDTVDSELVYVCQKIRDHFGRRVTVLSGCRCVSHNRTEGGARTSQHLYARAADLYVQSTKPAVVADYAESLGLSVGRYKTFTHIDTRTKGPARWGSN